MKAEEWLGHKAARDNSYQATFGSGGWGAGAQEVLGRVRSVLPLRRRTCLLKQYVLERPVWRCWACLTAFASLWCAPLSIAGLSHTAADW